MSNRAIRRPLSIAVLAATCLLSMLCMNGHRASAQAAAVVGGADAAGINAIGTANVQRRASVLRVQVQLVAQGADMRAALDRLKQVKDAAQKKVVALGGAGNAVRFATVQADAGATDPRQQMMRQMMAARMAARGKKPAATQASEKPTKLSIAMQADFPLQGATDDELLVAASQLQKKIRDADLADKKGGASTMTPEEQEEMEEAQVQQYGGGAPQVDPLEPTFSYVVKLTDEERNAAMAEAFKNAQQDAARIAKSAGIDLGALRSLTSTASSGASDPASAARNAYVRAYGGYVDESGGAGGGFPSDPAEAIGVQPIDVTYRVIVSASF